MNDMVYHNWCQVMVVVILGMLLQDSAVSSPTCIFPDPKDLRVIAAGAPPIFEVYLSFFVNSFFLGTLEVLFLLYSAFIDRPTQKISVDLSVFLRWALILSFYHFFCMTCVLLRCVFLSLLGCKAFVSEGRYLACV